MTPFSRWRRAVVSEISTRSFADGNGDGVGDIACVRSRLTDFSWAVAGARAENACADDMLPPGGAEWFEETRT